MVSDFQSDDITVDGTAIKGTLYRFKGWASGPLAGEGYFIALTFDDLDEDATGARVGLLPSASGMGLVDLDSDMDAVFKIEDKNRQSLIVEVYDDSGNVTRTSYSLKGLTLD